jgi:hypothetical protein
VYAREHGFDSWDELTQRVNLLAADSNAEATEPFLAAFRALQSRDACGVQALLQRNRRSRERGTNGNTLLSLTVSIAARTNRTVAMARRALLAAGADVNDSNDRGWTLHQAAYSSQCDIAQRLIHSGADLEVKPTAREARRSLSRCFGDTGGSRVVGPTFDCTGQPPCCGRPG